MTFDAFRRGRGLAGIIATATLAVVACQPAVATPSASPLPNAAPRSSSPAASNPASARPDALGFTVTACDYPQPPGGRPGGFLKTCGLMRVPEVRSKPGSQMIELRVVIVASADPAPPADPILFVAHGGGGDTISSLDGLTVKALRAHHDVVLVDGRGTGLSTPSLDCPEMDRASVDGLLLDNVGAAALQMEALTACAARLRAAGTDFEGYTTREVAADMDDLRLALGYEAVNLYGVSYGTREELEVMRSHPDGIRSVILDSALPTDVDALAEWGPNAALAVETLFDGCAADSTCATAHPDLATTFERLVAELDATPTTVRFFDPWGGVERTGRATGDTLILGLHHFLNPTNEIGRIPGMIDRLASGDTELLDYALALQANPFGAEAVYFSVFCRDSFAWTDIETVGAAGEATTPARYRQPFEFWSEFDIAVCPVFGAGRGAPEDQLPVVSDIPTLILSGAYDPITPPAWGPRVAETLSRSTQVVFAGVGHGVLGTNACAARIVGAFLLDPGSTLDQACAASLPFPNFRD